MHDYFEKYGLRYIRINESHLEIVRNWRNSDFVRSRMLFREVITPEMQQKWFHSVNNDRNYFYIVQLDDEYVAVVNIKNIEHNEGEPGFYLVNEQYKDTTITSLAQIGFFDFMFDDLKLDKAYSHVRKDNPEALKMSLFFGYIVEEKNGDNFYYMEFTKEHLKNNSKLNKLKKYINKR